MLDLMTIGKYMESHKIKFGLVYFLIIFQKLCAPILWCSENKGPST